MGKHILHDSLPTWCEIGHDGLTLLIRIHRKVLPEIQKRILFGASWVGGDVSQFLPPTMPTWGFGSGLNPAREPDSAWIRYRAELPVIRTQSKKEWVTNWQQATDLSRTLHLLFQALNEVKEYPDEGPPQLCLPVICAPGEQFGCCIGANLSPDAVKWIRGRTDCLQEDPREELRLEGPSSWMFNSWRTMWPQLDHPEVLRHFGITLRHPIQVSFRIPGSACGLGPDFNDMNCALRDSRSGYSLQPHNVDSVLQQLTLLMGLASLCQLMRPLPK